MFKRSTARLYDVINANVLPKAPWKNGGGATTELKVMGGADYDWRVSLADVTGEGEFSDFSGYNRSMFVAGGEVTMKYFDEQALDHQEVRGGNGDHVFSGADRIDWYLVTEDPCKILNVFTKKTSALCSFNKKLEAPSFFYVPTSPTSHAFYFSYEDSTVNLTKSDESFETVVVPKNHLLHLHQEETDVAAVTTSGKGASFKIEMF